MVSSSIGKTAIVEPYSGSMLPIVARFASGISNAGPEKLDELADDAVIAELFGDGDTKSDRCYAVCWSTRQLETDNARDQHRDRLTEHCGFGLDAADTPSDNAEPIDHGGVKSVPTTVSGYATPSRTITTRARCSMLTW